MFRYLYEKNFALTISLLCFLKENKGGLYYLLVLYPNAHWLCYYKTTKQALCEIITRLSPLHSRRW